MQVVVILVMLFFAVFLLVSFNSGVTLLPLQDSPSEHAIPREGVEEPPQPQASQPSYYQPYQQTIISAPKSNKGKVRIFVSRYSFFGSNYPTSTIVLNAAIGYQEAVNITGWKIKTKHGEATIGPGVEVYRAGRSVATDIVLKGGDYANVYPFWSKLLVNFRLNKCVGYLETSLFGFTPPLPLACPQPYQSRSEIAGFSNECQNYIDSLSTCQVPVANPPSPSGQTDAACRAFLSGLNYDSCVEKHRNDSDFLWREWRIYLNKVGDRSTILDGEHDRVQLFDLSGELVDEYVY